MTYRITVVPASTRAGKETIQALLEEPSKPSVHGIYRDLSKVPSEFKESPNFTATQGDVSDGNGLDFTSSDAVFYIPPPTYDENTTQADHATKTAKNIKKALQDASSVKKLLLFSSIGAQYDRQIGVLQLNHITDNILKDSVDEVLIVRPGYFHETWAAAFKVVDRDPPNLDCMITPLGHKVPMVGLADVRSTCAKALLNPEKKPSPYIFNLFGPRHYSGYDIKEIIEEITGKTLNLVPVEKDDLFAHFTKHQIPVSHVQGMVDMVTATLPGGIMAGDFAYGENVVRGEVDMLDSLRKLYTA